MAVVGTNHAWRTGWLAVAAALCGGVALGMAKSPDVQFELGYAYENGNFHGWLPGFAQSHTKAAHWLSRAAQANHPRAQYMLGILHAHGWGVPRDRARSVDWFARSARNDYAPACFHLGWMYHKGDGALASRMDPSREGLTLARQWLANPPRQHTETMPE